MIMKIIELCLNGKEIIMEWINIIQMAFGGGVVAGIVEVWAMSAENVWA